MRLLYFSPKIQESAVKWIILIAAIIVSGVGAIKIAELPPKWITLVFLAGFFFCVLILSGDIRKSFLALILFDIPFQLDIYIGHRSDMQELGIQSGWNFSITTVALIVLYTLWVLESLSERHSNSNKNRLFYNFRPLAVYIVFCLLSIIVAQDKQLALYKNFLLLQQFLLFIYIIGTVKSRDDIKFILGMLLVGVILEGTIVILLRNIGHTIKFAGLKARVDNGLRIGGTIGGPNTAGAYFSLLLVPALSMMIANAGKIYKWLGILAFSLGTVAIILTFSRGGWIAFFISGVVFIFFSWSRGWLSYKIPVVIIVVSILLALFLYEPLIGRIFGDDRGAALSRIPLMKLAFRIIEAKPILGVGVNNFAVIMEDYISRDLMGIWLYTVHNKYLLVWAETGVGGLLAFLWFLGSSIRNGWRCWLSQDPFLAPAGLALAAAFIGHMVHMNFDTFQNRAPIQILWICCALSTAMINILKSEKMNKNYKLRIR